MKIPMKVDYGVRALVELALRYGDGHTQTAVIARQQGIPEAYLDQLMTALNKFGFVQSRRGPQGGHALAMDPKDIDLNMVMDHLDSSNSPLDCLINPTTAPYLTPVLSKKSGKPLKPLSVRCSAI